MVAASEAVGAQPRRGSRDGSAFGPDRLGPPLEIREPGMIHIRVVINGGPDELHLGSLQVMSAQS